MFNIVCCRIVVWGKGLNLSHIQQICSRRLCKHLDSNKVNLSKWTHTLTYWIDLETLWQKEKLLVLSNFFFCHKVFKSRLLQKHQKVSTWGKGLSTLVEDEWCLSQSLERINGRADVQTHDPWLDIPRCYLLSYNSMTTYWAITAWLPTEL